MTSYDILFNSKSEIQVGHNSGNIYYNTPAPKHEVEAVFDVPDLLSPYFTGRKNETTNLKELFQASHTTGPARCIVYGMPGLGKTQLALQLAYSSREDYPFIFWISGASTEKLNSGFSVILDHIGGEARDDNARIRAAKKWLENQDKKWLLIVDNVNEQTASHLRDMLPVKNANGNIVITTRYEHIAEILAFAHGEKHTALELKNFDEHDAVELFLAIGHKSGQDSDKSNEQEDVKTISRKIGYLPLAIEQAASLSNTPGQSVRKILEVYTNSGPNEAFQWDSETIKHEDKSVMACFGPVLDQLKQSSPEAYTLLRIFAFLDPESISLEVVKHGIINFQSRKDDVSYSLPTQRSRMSKLKERVWKKSDKVILQTTCHTTQNNYPEDEECMKYLSTAFESPVKLQKLIQTLRRLSVVKVKHHDNSIFWMHDLVHQLVRQNIMNEDQQARWLHIAVDAIGGSFAQIEDPEDVKNWKLSAKFVSHIQRLRDYSTAQRMEDNALLDMEDRIAIYLNSYGSYAEAAKMLQISLASRRKASGRKDIVTLYSMHALANAYYNLDRLMEAEELYTEVMAERRKLLGAEDAETLKTTNNLAMIYARQGRLQAAEKLQRDVVVAMKRALGAEHPVTLKGMSILASTHQQQGKWKEAEELGTEVSAAMKKVFGADHPDTLRSMSVLAVTYQQQGRLREAEELGIDVLAAMKRVLRPDHPDTLMCINGLVCTYSRQGKLEEAKELGIEVLAAMKRVFGADHPQTLTTMNNLASTLEATGAIDEAIELMDRLVVQRTKVLGIDHPDTQHSAYYLDEWRNERTLDSNGTDDNTRKLDD